MLTESNCTERHTCKVAYSELLGHPVVIRKGWDVTYLRSEAIF